MRALIRAEEWALACLAGGIGVLAGLGVVIINVVTSRMHAWLFALAPGTGLSGATSLPTLRALAVPMLGGAVLGLAGWWLARARPRRVIDPVEANALHGGRMSLTDSVIVAAQTTWSNGVGASVGLEAGYAQLGAGLASWCGRRFRLRRRDLRVLVGCGAAAAIGGAFNAPLCGAFYGIELVIGAYAVATLPPVVIASLAGTLTTRIFLGDGASLNVTLPASVPDSVYPLILLLGVGSGLAGIGIMRGVTLVEALFRRSAVPAWLRPALGGAAVGVLGGILPQTMSSGHAALHADIDVGFSLSAALVLLLAKAVASAVSIGSGFRGGLFFASLFLGMLFGKVFACILAFLPFIAPMPSGLYAVVGMSAVAVAIIGGPLTMTFLALESTANFAVTMAVLTAAIAAALIVRRLFGYSFATWRFHLRGSAVRSAADVGWIDDLTVGRMMRRDQPSVDARMSLDAFRRDYPPGEVQRVVVLAADGRYAGLAYPAEAHGDLGKELVAEIVHHPEEFLLAAMTVKEAAAAFEAAEADGLAVLDGPRTRRVLGILTEQFALRRYAEALDRHQSTSSGG